MVNAYVVVFFLFRLKNIGSSVAQNDFCLSFRVYNVKRSSLDSIEVLKSNHNLSSIIKWSWI